MFSAGTQHAKRAGAPVWSIVPPIWSSKSRSASPWHDERRSETRLSAAAGGVRLRVPICRAHAETCGRMAQSLGPENAGLRDVMREIADRWRRVAADAEAKERHNSN